VRACRSTCSRVLRHVPLSAQAHAVCERADAMLAAAEERARRAQQEADQAISAERAKADGLRAVRMGCTAFGADIYGQSHHDSITWRPIRSGRKEVGGTGGDRDSRGRSQSLIAFTHRTLLPLPLTAPRPLRRHSPSARPPSPPSASAWKLRAPRSRLPVPECWRRWSGGVQRSRAPGNGVPPRRRTHGRKPWRNCLLGNPLLRQGACKTGGPIDTSLTETQYGFRSEDSSL